MSNLEVDKKISQAISIISQNGGKYQCKLFIFFLIIFTQIALNALVSPMVFANPLFTSKGQISTQAYCCLNMDRCSYDNNFTGTYYADLYCEHRDARMVIQSIFAIGCILGMLTVPLLGDLKGKKFGINVCLSCMLIASVLLFFGIYAFNYIAIGFGMFLSAYGSSSMAATSYSISSDFFSSDLKKKAIIYFYTAWGLTDMSAILIWYFIPNWKIYLFFILFIPIAALFVYFQIFFIESVHFLIYSHKDWIQINQAIQRLAQVNGSSQNQLAKSKSIILQIYKQVNENKREKQQQKSNLKEKLNTITKNKKYLKAVILIALIKMGYYCFYYGAQGSLERTGFNFGISVFLFGLGQVTGYLTGSKIIPYMKRKSVIISATLGVALIGTTYLSNIVETIPLIASLMLYISFVVDSWNFSAICLLIKSTAVGTIYGMSYFARFALPFVIGFFNEKGIHPIIAASILMLSIASIPLLFVEETYRQTNQQNKPRQIHQQAKNQSYANKTDRNNNNKIQTANYQVDHSHKSHQTSHYNSHYNN